MESVYDLLRELDISADYLYKQHTGHRIFNDGCDESSESSDGSCDSDTENKPPIFPYEVLIANLSTCEADLTASGESTQETPETIVRKLQEYITENQCFICNEYGKKHYMQSSHFKGVKAWIEGQLKHVKQPVDWELIFCQVCNQPLTGNEQGRAHYSGYPHQVKASSFCTPCLRVIDLHNMVSHRTSKQHIQNEAMSKTVVKCEPEEFSCGFWEDTFIKTQSSGPTVQTIFPENILPGEHTYASILKRADPKPDNTLPVKTQAETVADKVGPNAKGSRSKKKKKKTRPQSTGQSIVDNYKESSLYGIPKDDNCDDLGTKDVPNAVLSLQDQNPNKKVIADGKDIKTRYSIHSSNYYEVLMDSNTAHTSPEVDNHSSLNRSVESSETEAPVEETVISNDEAIVDGVKKRRKRRKRKASRYSEDISSVADEVSESAETPRDDRENVNKQRSTPMTPEEMHSNMYRLLYWMMRWNYCHICNDPVRRQEKGNHYKQKGHIRNFTEFIEAKGLPHGYSMKNIGAVYCLPCDTLFATTNEAIHHYSSEKHERAFNNFCPVCMTHGNCNSHKEFKQKVTPVVDQFFIEKFSHQGNNPVQIPEKDAGKKDKDIINTLNTPKRSFDHPKSSEFPKGKTSKSKESGAKMTYAQTCTNDQLHPELFKELFKTLKALEIMPMEKRLSCLKTFNKELMEMRDISKLKSVEDKNSCRKNIPNEHKLVDRPVNLEPKSLARENIIPESTDEILTEQLLLDDKAAEELAKFDSLLQTFPPEDRLTCLIKCNRLLTEMSENNKQHNPTVQPQLIISDNTKCLNEIRHMETILIHFFKSVSPLQQKSQIPTLIMCVRSLKQTVEVMLQTGIDIPIKQVFNFSQTNFPDIVELGRGLDNLKATLLDEVCRLRTFVESQTTFKSEKVTKLFRDFNITILVNIKRHREDKQLFDNIFYGNVAGNVVDNGRDSYENSSFVDSDDDLLFENALECSCLKLCHKIE